MTAKMVMIPSLKATIESMKVGDEILIRHEQFNAMSVRKAVRTINIEKDGNMFFISTQKGIKEGIKVIRKS